ncbi:MAG: radical SAM protein [Nitrospirae bacterium]|nr:radical SAM protein [Nitrospirota bacterium]
MKILFATPPLSMAKRYGTLAGVGSSSPTLGILQLAAVTRQHAHETFLLDAAALDLDQVSFLERLVETAPDILGLSVTTLSISHAARIAEASKKMVPGLLVIIGGPHISAVPVETMERFTVFDVAVIGEGEETVLELLLALSEVKPLSAVSGIVYRDGSGVQMNPRRPFLKTLDILPRPAWDMLEGFPQHFYPPIFKTRRLPAALLVTSRGCPNTCIFCDRSVFGSSCHMFSASYVVEMMVELYDKFGVREFCFEDDTFITFHTRLVEICHHLIDLKLDISWSCLGRVNQVSEENLRLMKRAGCWQISFGIESGSQEILDIIHKKVTLQQIRRALQISRDAGLLNKGFFIVGHPGETKKTLQLTYDFIMGNPLDDISVTMLTPFPGTELHARAREFGTLDADWEKMNLLNTVFVPFGLTECDLLQAQKKMIRDFYLRPRIIGSYISRVFHNPAMLNRLLKGFRSFVRSI